MDALSDKLKNGFEGKRVVVVGDPVADQFVMGSIDRVSREAPVFILRHDETVTVPGGAANAAANIASLGAEAVLIGVLGEDANGEALRRSLEQRGVETAGLVADKEGATTTKVRVLAGQHYAQRQQVIRIDYGGEKRYHEDLYSEMKEKIALAAQTADAIILSDYSYGSAIPEIGNWCTGISAEFDIGYLIDSRHRLESFWGGSATPNQEEVEEILGKNFTSTDCEELRARLRLDSLLVTRGNKGMMLFEGDKPPVDIPIVGSDEPVDVTGAGDTVIAAYALGLASGLTFLEAASIANHAGGLVVMKRGTATVTFDELSNSLRYSEDSGSAVGTS
ncbi:MAG: hypothetical protein DWQ47_01400 [Acidobacteria bacterium]|nr:MAG: hypothetical protein DWQ32_11860 [Acidobacteriota bacterium]REK04156.1 MAG: hypothetical protein DWQ38_01385 [Acidobacteriota bacterium]REK15318.1 MAG: hypothetical protein DWQ43_17550 [Acidobacteriota bacterium]REK46408.1 MAG: hypothetical protein DWQ47_01400 [Acidobacteriota bacterium]